MGGADVCTPGLDCSSTEVPTGIEAERLAFQMGLVGHLGTLGHFRFSGFQPSLHRAGDGRHGLAGEDAGAP